MSYDMYTSVKEIIRYNVDANFNASDYVILGIEPLSDYKPKSKTGMS